MRQVTIPQSDVVVSNYADQNSPESLSSTSKLLPVRRNSFTGSQCLSSGAQTNFSSDRNFSNDGVYRSNQRTFFKKFYSPGAVRRSCISDHSRTLSSSSENACHSHYHQNSYNHVEHRNSDVFFPPNFTNPRPNIPSRERSFSSSLSGRYQRHYRTSSLGSHHSRNSSISDVVTPLSLQQSALAQEAIRAPRINRSSTRRSIGQEWTEHHWHKMKDLEQESERARRCSKLSSGFAPLMVFGGLVFICIGISASTNTGKDKERLKNLSAVPLILGVFMILLGATLIITWFGCRSRAKRLDQKLLHGSHGNLAPTEETLVQAVVTKLYDQMERVGLPRPGRPQTPTFPEIAVDGAIVNKSPPPTIENSRTGTCSHCTAEIYVSRETSV